MRIKNDENKITFNLKSFLSKKKVNNKIIIKTLIKLDLSPIKKEIDKNRNIKR
jgi:hypothetical protein